MYQCLFPQSLSCDLSYSTAIGPKRLFDLLAKNKSIPFFGSIMQFLISCAFAVAECLLLAVMAYDWHKAISNPLFLTVSMPSRVCSLLITGVYMEGMADSLIHKTLTFHLCSCVSNEINHFFYDIHPLLFCLAQTHRSMN